MSTKNRTPNPETRFDGSRSNRKVSGGNSKRITKSKLRILEEELLKMQEKALANIKKSIDGETVDADMLGSSKWLVNSVVTVSKAANVEEISYNKLKFEVKDSLETGEQTPEEIKKELKPRLSLVFNEPEDE